MEAKEKVVTSRYEQKYLTFFNKRSSAIFHSRPKVDDPNAGEKLRDVEDSARSFKFSSFEQLKTSDIADNPRRQR